MKWSRTLDYSIWIALAGVAFALIWRKGAGPAEGSAAPPIHLAVLDGKRHFDLAEHRGKPVLIEMFASWCGACRRSAPAVADTWREHSKEIEFLGIMVDDDRHVAAETKRDWNIPFDVALDDGSVYKTYQVELLPTFVLIDREGVVRRVWAGMPSRAQLENWMLEF